MTSQTGLNQPQWLLLLLLQRRPNRAGAGWLAGWMTCGFFKNTTRRAKEFILVVLVHSAAAAATRLQTRPGFDGCHSCPAASPQDDNPSLAPASVSRGRRDVAQSAFNGFKCWEKKITHTHTHQPANLTKKEWSSSRAACYALTVTAVTHRNAEFVKRECCVKKKRFALPRGRKKTRKQTSSLFVFTLTPLSIRAAG